MIKNTLVVGFEFISAIVFSAPRGHFFGWFKKMFLRLLGAKVGKSVTFYPGIKLSPGTNLYLGDQVDLAWGVIITTRGKVHIGDRTLVGYNTLILSTNHLIPRVPEPIFSAGHSFAPIHIGNDVWIGGNCTILAGVTIGEGAVVAAGAESSGEFPRS